MQCSKKVFLINSSIMKYCVKIVKKKKKTLKHYERRESWSFTF